MFAFGDYSPLPAGDLHFFDPESKGGVRGMSAMVYDPTNVLYDSSGDIIKTGP